MADAGSNSAPTKTNAMPKTSVAAPKPAYQADTAIFAALTAKQAFVNGTRNTPAEIIEASASTGIGRRIRRASEP